MHIHESKFLQQHVNSALGLVMVGLMAVWTTIYYFNEKIEVLSANYTSIEEGSIN